MDKILKTLLNTAACLLAISMLVLGSVDTAMAQGNPPLTVLTQQPIMVCGLDNRTIQPVPVSIASTGGNVSFTVSYSSPAGWLTVNQIGTTATTVAQNLISIGVVGGTTNLPAGSFYPGIVTLTANNTNININTELFVGSTTCNSSGSGSLSATPNPATFNLTSPQTMSSQQVTISNSSSTLISITDTVILLNGTNWLTVSNTQPLISPNGSTALTVSVNTSGLTPGVTYTGNIDISGSNGAVLTVTVTLIFSSTTGNSEFSASPSPIIQNLDFGAAGVTVPIQITNLTGSQIAASFLATTGTGQPWLSVSTQLGGTSQGIGPHSTISVNAKIDPSGLTASIYSGNITVTDTSPGGSSLSIPVTLNYGTSGGGNSVLSGNPNPLSFSIKPGTTSVQTKNLIITTNTGTVQFTASATPPSFLSVGPINNTVAPGQPVSLAVDVDPTKLPTGTSNGTITLTPGGGGSTLQVPVNITFGGAPTLTLSPAQLNFAYQTGLPFPQPQTLSLTSNVAATFTVQTSTSSGGLWLVASPLNVATSGSGGAPTNITVTIQPGGLAANTYSGLITITDTDSSIQQTIPVTLVVSNQPVLTLGNSGTTFSYQTGSSTLPTQQSVLVTSSGNQLTFNTSVTPVSGGAFLIATPSSGTTPQTLTFSLNPAVISLLTPNTYTDNVVLTASGAGNSPVTYPVLLNVTNSPLLNASQTLLNFNYEIGQTQALPVQILSITSTGMPLNYNVSATSNCNSFLSAATMASTTPATIAVSVNPAGRLKGTCTGMVSVASPGAANSPLNIPVTFTISDAPLLNASPSAINITTHAGTNPAAQNISLTSSDGTTPINFTVTSATNNGSGWLSVTPATGATPGVVSAAFNTAALAVGTYSGSITVVATGSNPPANSPVTIPVTVIVTSAATAATSPTSLTFTQSFQGPLPHSQTLQVMSSTSGFSFSASPTTFNGGGWLMVSNITGITPGTVTVSANGSSLSPGTYSGAVNVIVTSAANSPITVPVTLIVGPSQALTVSPGSLTFSYDQGATLPDAQTVQVGSIGGNVSFTTASAATSVAAVSDPNASATPNFLTVSPTSGTTPATLTIGLNSAVLALLTAGTYNGTVTVMSPGLANQTISVTLTVTTPPPPAVTLVANGASFAPGPIAPGEIITLKGTNLGPTTGVVFQLTPAGKVPTTLANVSVAFNGFAAPLLYVSAGQINAIVPYEIAGQTTANLFVNVSGVQSASLPVQVGGTSPSIFSTTLNGNGQGAILNQNGTINNSGHPAAKGSVIVIYATGEGQLTPSGITGSVTSSTGPNFPKPVGNVEVSIGGQPTVLAYAGEAPGLVSGVLQVNAFVPKNIGSGPQAVVLTVGNGTNNKQSITAAIQ